jgi:prepilin-type N-terminal cleavage/methylation domain-containing protein
MMLNNKKGFTLGEVMVVLAIVLIVGALMWPFIRHSNERLGNIACANNLRKIGRALYIYAREHEGRFPPTMRALYDEQYLADTRLMDCPASKTIGTVESPDYIYTAGLSVRSPSQDPLVTDKAANHPGGGKNFLFVNGAVDWAGE